MKESLTLDESIELSKQRKVTYVISKQKNKNCSICCEKGICAVSSPKLSVEFCVDTKWGRILLVYSSNSLIDNIGKYLFYESFLIVCGFFVDKKTEKSLVAISQESGLRILCGDVFFDCGNVVEGFSQLKLVPSPVKSILKGSQLKFEKTVKVASVQCPSTHAKTQENMKRLKRLVKEAASNGAKIIVLPETAVQGYLSQDLKTNWRLPGRKLDHSFENSVNPRDHAEFKDGKSIKEMEELAKELKVYITVPYLEKDKKGHYYNSIALASPKGIVENYRKNCPWPLPEVSWCTKGKGHKVVQTEYGKVR